MKNSGCAVLTMLFILQGCTTMKIPDYPQSTIASIPKAETVNDLTVAAKPFTNKNDLEKYFGTNLIDYGIVPVYIITENRNRQTSFVISKDRVSLTNKSETLTQGARTDESTSGNALFIAGAATFILSPIAGVPMMFIGPKLTSDAEKIKQNMAKKELQSRTVSPGKTVDGFVYFKFSDGEPSNLLKECKITLQAMELGSNTIHQFTFPVE